MNLREDEEQIEDPILEIFNSIKTLIRGKVDIDYKDEFSTVFGVLVNSIIELKFNSETKVLIVKLYKEPPEDVTQNLAMSNPAQTFDLSIPHVLIQNSEEITLLFSYYKVIPEEEIKKVILQDHNVESYKDLLNLGYEIFINNFGE